MTGRVIDRETASFLVLLIPLAIAAVILLTAWPYILGLIGLIIAWKLWQNYQWLQRCEKINPFFNQLIREHKGYLTPMDLSLKANLTGGTAKRFLDRKAEEYGAQRKQLQDQGIVYYFLTASTLGSILDDSEPVLEEKTFPSTSKELTRFSSTATVHSEKPSVPEIAEAVEYSEKPSELVVEESPPVEDSQSLENSTSQEIEKVVEETPSPVEDPQSLEDSTSQETEQENETALSSDVQTQQQESTVDAKVNNPPKLELIQADLAKRLEINPSTVGRRKSDPDFAEWSQSKDPDGIAWRYKRKTKTFVPIEEEKS